jgi:hypothetical protein
MNNNIIETLTRIEAKLDAVIKALHEYDDDNIYSGYDEPNEALLKAAGLYNELKANKRMDIIGQNGNEGTHYVTNEEADEDAKINKPANIRGNKNNVKRNKGKKSAIVEHEKYRSPHKH